jgi:prolyl 4-hydroxylase
LISTRQLASFDTLFWKTDHKNITGQIMTRKRKREVYPTVTWGRYSLTRMNNSPHIYLIDNFLSELELVHCESLISKSRFMPSYVDDPDSKSTMVDKYHRTSTFVAVAKQADSKISSIERKAAEILGLTVDRLEPMQLVRYQCGQFFGIHHDLGNLHPDGTVTLPTKALFCKRRIATFFCYLNHVEDGGSTYFPECNHLRITPKRGRAILFCNILKNGDADGRTIHAGEPVLREGSIKYGLNIWACEK